MVSDRYDKKELAAEKGVSVETVNYWRKRGLPALGERGERGKLLFEMSAVDEWLTAEGIFPGAHGAEGGRARAEMEEPEFEQEREGYFQDASGRWHKPDGSFAPQEEAPEPEEPSGAPESELGDVEDSGLEAEVRRMEQLAARMGGH